MAQIADKRRWLVVGLVFIAIVLNYVDRQILALLKPTLQLEFDWTDRDYSHMASVFQFAAALAFLGIDRLGLHCIARGPWRRRIDRHTPAVKTAATYFNAKERSFVLGLGGPRAPPSMAVRSNSVTARI